MLELSVKEGKRHLLDYSEVQQIEPILIILYPLYNTYIFDKFWKLDENGIVFSLVLAYRIFIEYLPLDLLPDMEASMWNIQFTCSSRDEMALRSLEP